MKYLQMIKSDTAVSSAQFLPTTSANNQVMPFAPTVASFPMPQSMVRFPTQQTSLVAPVTPHVVSTSQHFNPLATRNTFRQPTTSEPLITVFVGNISEKVPHIMMKLILATCGNIASWKSEQGFGFCEYYQSEGALLAIKVLHDMEVGGKKLAVKVNTKTQKILDQLKEEKEGTNDSEKNQKFEEYCRQKINSMIANYNNEIIREKKQNENKVSIVDDVRFDMVPIKEEKKKLIFQEMCRFFQKNMKKQEENEIERKKNQKKLKLNGRHKTPSNKDSEKNRMIHRREERGTRYKKKEKTNKKTRDEREKNERTDKEREKRINEKTRKEKLPKKRRGYFYKNKLQEKEMEEELELKKYDDRLREKELAYQEKLNQWLKREKQKKKELSKERANKQIREEEKEKNAKQLKEFMKNYDDDDDDHKYYKGKYLQQRIKLREREIEEDERDRQKEKDELEIIPKKVHNNIKLKFAKVLKAREENMNKPKLLIYVAENQKDKLKCYEMEIKNQKNMEIEQECQKHVMEKAQTPSPQQPATSTSSSAPSQTPPPEFALISQPTQSITSMIEKKMNTKDVFNNDDEESPRSKKRKLNQLDYYNEKKEKECEAVEEKKKSIRQLIEDISTDKDKLFSFHLDWTVVDLHLIRKRIWPWINKKIIEYIGEPETTLVDFICSKVENGSSPQSIIDDVQLVLDDDAELFVINIWRLIVYEVEKQKHKMD